MDCFEAFISVSDIDEWEKKKRFLHFGSWIRALCHIISASFGTAASPGKRLGACLIPGRALCRA